MSGIDVLELGFGLFLGYWIVARLLPDGPARDKPGDGHGDRRP